MNEPVLKLQDNNRSNSLFVTPKDEAGGSRRRLTTAPTTAIHKETRGNIMAGKVKLDRFWNIVQVADYLTVTETTVRRWVAAGQFPEPVLFGPRSRRWRESTVLAWVEARAKASQEAG